MLHIPYKLFTVTGCRSVLHLNITTCFCLIQGKGIPNRLAGTGTPRKITTDLLPDVIAAADMYDSDMGSSLTRISSLESDPFLSEADKVRAEQLFAQHHPDLSVVFYNAVYYSYAPFKEALIYLIDVTKRCSLFHVC